MEQPTQQQVRSVRAQRPVTTIDLLDLMKYLWKKAVYIIAATVLGGLIAYIYAAFMITPQYSASVMIYVNASSVSVGNTSVKISNGDLSASRNLVDTYLVILGSRETLQEVIDDLDLSYTYRQLSNMISGGSVNDTEVFRVTVTSTDPQEAADIANDILKVLRVRIKKIIDGSQAVSVDGAIPNHVPVSPNIPRYTVMGALVAMIIVGAAIVIQFLMDTEIHSESYLLNTYPDIPLLTVVPDINASDHGYGYSYGYGYGYGHKP